MADDREGKTGEEQSEEGIGLEDARAKLGDLVLRAGFGNERIVLTRKGRKTAVLIGMKDFGRLEALDESPEPESAAA